MKKLIVGCGYLGRRVAAAWLEAGHEVFALTRSENNADELRTHGIQPIIGDVTNCSTLKQLPDIETAFYAVGWDRTSEKSMDEVYVTGLKNVLQELEGKVNRLIYISSTSVYGQADDSWIDENSPTEPTTPSGKISLDAERVVWDFFPRLSSAENCGANVLRLAGIYGPGRLIGRAAALKSEKPLTTNADGWLNLIHVDDAVQAVSACETRGILSETYLVSDDRPIQRREFYEALAALVGAPPPQFQTVENSTRQQSKRCSNRKIHTDLEIRLSYPTITEGLPHAVRSSDEK